MRKLDPSTRLSPWLSRPFEVVDKVAPGVIQGWVAHRVI